MARPFSNYNAKALVNTHRQTINKLEEIVSAAKTAHDEALSASDALAAAEGKKLLKDIPVEELARTRKGIRVKTLRDNGYETIADVSAASVRKLTAINGISQDAAEQILDAVKEINATASKGVKIRLSADDKSKEATQLILALAKCRRIFPLAGDSEKLLSANKPAIEKAATELTAAAGSLKWLFASAEKKQKAADAYDMLSALREGDYGREAKELTDAFTKSARLSPTDAWKEFTAEPVAFFNLLEIINPGLLGNDDTMYGLPEELAQAIQDEPFFPEGLNCELRRYQLWGVKYILHQWKALLGDEMGLGKTVQAIATMVSLSNVGGTHFAVVCPASVVTNWCREIAKFSNLSVIKIHGSGRDKALEEWIEKGGVAVTTYETTAFIKLPDDFKFTELVVDEAHYIKNPEAQRTANVKRLCKSAHRLLFMTGTALENRVDEMLELIRILSPNTADKAKGMAFMSSAPQFRETVAPVYYRRKREDVLTELPELMESREWCTMNRAEEAAYEKAVLSGNYAEARRVSWNVSDIKDSSKANRLLELVEEAESEGRKIIVFSFFLDTISKVSALLGSKCMQPINGSVSPQRRQEIIDEFNTAPAGSVLAAQIQSGGTGLNIQAASVVILCEPQFKPSIENQAISRAYRMGQTRNVLVYRLLCDDTVDELILQLIESKQAEFDAFADASSAAEQSTELDEKSFGRIMDEELERIKEKKAKEANR